MLKLGLYKNNNFNLRVLFNNCKYQQNYLKTIILRDSYFLTTIMNVHNVYLCIGSLFYVYAETFFSFFLRTQCFLKATTQHNDNIV